MSMLEDASLVDRVLPVCGDGSRPEPSDDSLRAATMRLVIGIHAD